MPRHRNLLRALAAGLLLAVTVSCATAPSVPVVYIVRHAEKAEGADPPLSAAGARRAAQLAEALHVDRIYSTDTQRTRSTAAPLAARLGLTVEIYDHRQPQELAARVRAHGGATLIVGHSNTIAELASAFGGEPGAPVADDEYDRLYVLALREAATVTEIRRYGE